MSKFTEKLGMKKLERYENRLTGDFLFSEHEIRALEKERDELLEALVLTTLRLESINKQFFHAGVDKIILKNISVIEKATDKPWQEVKNIY